MFNRKYDGTYILKVKALYNSWFNWRTFYDRDMELFADELFGNSYLKKKLLVYKDNVLEQELKFTNINDILSKIDKNKISIYYAMYINNWKKTYFSPTWNDKHIGLLNLSDLTSNGVFNLMQLCISKPEIKKYVSLLKGHNKPIEDYLANGVTSAVEFAYETGNIDYARKLSLIALVAQGNSYKERNSQLTCPYCHKQKPMIDNNIAWAAIQDKQKRLLFNSDKFVGNSEIEGIDINYCPICGRKLGD